MASSRGAASTAPRRRRATTRRARRRRSARRSARCSTSSWPGWTRRRRDDQDYRGERAMRNPELVDVAALLLRLSLATMFFAHAWLKLRVFPLPGTVKSFESLGVPGFLASLTIAAELGGGLLLLLGIGT